MSASRGGPQWWTGRPPEPGGQRPALAVLVPGSTGPEAASGWLACPLDADVAIGQLPGRGARLFEEPVTDMTEIAGHLTATWSQIAPLRWSVLGHCSGAFLAIELAQRMTAAGRSPQRVFVSSSRSPDDPTGPDSERSAAAAHLLAMTDKDLLAFIAVQRGFDAGAVDQEIGAALVRSYRASILAAGSYRWRHQPLRVPVEVWQGRDDDVVRPEHAGAWQAVAAAPVDLVTFAGARSHFETPDDAAVARVRACLAATTTATAGRTAGRHEGMTP